MRRADSGSHHYLKEAETGVITLPDDDQEIVELMIDYFYTLDYPPFPAQVTAPPPVMVGLLHPQCRGTEP